MAENALLTPGRNWLGGYTPSAKNFDALVIGYFDGDKLIYAARTRNGFTPPSRVELFKKIAPLEIPECPFANLKEKKGGHWASVQELPVALGRAGCRSAPDSILLQ